MTGKVRILQLAALPEQTERVLMDVFDVLKLPENRAQHAEFLDSHGKSIRGIGVRHVRIDSAMLETMPALEIISSFSAGLDDIDTVEAARRGIVVCNTSSILAEDVADLAIALSIAVTRSTVRGHEFVRDGFWTSKKFPLGRSLRSLNTGIVGLGQIGAAVARRLEVMGLSIGYYGPRKKPVQFTYFDEIGALAEWADLLIVTCPATAETTGLIDAAVLDKLGTQGFLVNVSRGIIVDEGALISSLANDGIAGAGLDVFEHEPHVPNALLGDARVVLSPHMGSGTRETRQQMADQLVRALVEHFEMVPAAA